MDLKKVLNEFNPSTIGFYTSTGGRVEIYKSIKLLKEDYPDKKIIIWDIKNAKDMVKLQSVPQLDGIINSVPEARDLK